MEWNVRTQVQEDEVKKILLGLSDGRDAGPGDKRQEENT